MAGGLDAAGALVAWQHVNFNSGGSAIATPYQIPNVLTEFKSCDQPLRSGSYRALASTANAFARESFMDELAAAADVDPLEFRLRHLTNDRLRAVLVAAAERFGWKEAWKKQPSRQRTGVGLACGIEKESYVACCAKVEVNEADGTFKVVRVVEGVRMRRDPEPREPHGPGRRLHHHGDGRRVDRGNALQGRGDAQPDSRATAFPASRTSQDRGGPGEPPDLPSVGAGETPIIGIAPAIGNALFNATQCASARCRSAANPGAPRERASFPPRSQKAVRRAQARQSGLK